MPAFLEKEHGIQVQARIIRTEIGREEIGMVHNTQAAPTNHEICKAYVNHARRSIFLPAASAGEFKPLDLKINAVKGVYPESRIIPLLITHYVRPKFVEQAREQGIR